uniref:Retinoblastoma-associated protein A-box domain-containing protein n=1 Tax=Globodera pallida TaxID=36090 RepID=A0A183C8P6_GLOPA
MLELGDQPSKEFLELFSKLDSTISGELIEKAWKQYDTIGQQIVLEGNRNSWMACAFFTNVWQATPIGKELICKYSLSKLLSICEISVLEFFDKLDSWAELIVASRRLLDFYLFFDIDSPQKAIYPLLPKLTSCSLFEFVWTLFVALRKQFNSSQEDLLHSFHLLLCLFDYVFDALQRSGQERLLNSSFGPITARIALKEFNQLYQTALMGRSEVDERIFLAPILQNFSSAYYGEFDEVAAVSVLRMVGDLDQQQTMDVELMIKINAQDCFEKLSSRKTNSRAPLSGKSYTICPNALSSNEQNEAQKLHNLLSGFNGIEDELLVYLTAEDVGLNSDFDSEFQSNIAQRIADIEQLFYYLLLRVVTHDRERAVNLGMEMQLDLGVIFQNVEFLASVFLCASELILFAYDSERHFPWTFELFRGVVTPIAFYKIFELVIGAGVGLSRGAVNHLNRVEESVLDEFAWKADSQLWSILSVSRSVEAFGEPSTVPGSQILSPSSTAYIQRSIDLPPAIVIFFKKVFHLSAIRLSDLCERLRIVDDLTRHKIWTLFEHVFRTKTHLLMDRHLDQLLMCVLYIIAKVCMLDITFQNIMCHYRRQPQASSRIYRAVLIEDGNTSKALSSESEKKNYDDLISFYNRVFVNCVKELVKMLHPAGSDGKENVVPLIPFPKIPLNPLTPVKIVADRINVMSMSQYAQNFAPSQPGRFVRGRYNFHQSPSKDLKNINALIGGGASSH